MGLWGLGWRSVGSKEQGTPREGAAGGDGEPTLLCRRYRPSSPRETTATEAEATLGRPQADGPVCCEASKLVQGHTNNEHGRRGTEERGVTEDNERGEAAVLSCPRKTGLAPSTAHS